MSADQTKGIPVQVREFRVVVQPSYTGQDRSSQESDIKAALEAAGLKVVRVTHFNSYVERIHEKDCA